MRLWSYGRCDGDDVTGQTGTRTPGAVRGVLKGALGGVHRRVRHRVDAAREAATTRGDDSGMTAIEFVLLTPVLFFMIFADRKSVV